MNPIIISSNISSQLSYKSYFKSPITVKKIELIIFLKIYTKLVFTNKHKFLKAWKRI